MIFISVVAVQVILLLAGCTTNTQNHNNSNTNTNTNSNSELQQNETEVRIPISDISTTAQFYSYDSSGVAVRYFAVKDTQRNIHVAGRSDWQVGYFSGVNRVSFLLYGSDALSMV